MPKSEREIRKTKRFLPYERAELQSRAEKTVDARRKILHYYKWKRATLEEGLASTNKNLQKLLGTMSEIQQLPGTSGTCQEERKASLRMRCELIINEYIPMHRKRLENAQRELDYVCFQIGGLEAWLDDQSRQSDAVALQFSGMRLSADDDDRAPSKTPD